MCFLWRGKTGSFHRPFHTTDPLQLQLLYHHRPWPSLSSSMPVPRHTLPTRWCTLREYIVGMKSPQMQCFNRDEKDTTLFGARYMKYQPEMIFLDLFRVRNMFLWRTTSKAPEHESVAHIIPSTV